MKDKKKNRPSDVAGWSSVAAVVAVLAAVIAVAMWAMPSSSKQAPPTTVAQDGSGVKSDVQSYLAIHHGLFTVAECDSIVKLASTHALLDEEQVKVMHGSKQVLDTTRRSARMQWLCSHSLQRTRGGCLDRPELSWIVGRIHQVLSRTLLREVGLSELDPSLSSNNPAIDAMVITYGVDGFHEWHVDANPGNTFVSGTRLISMTVQLDDEEAYEGGSLSFGDVNASRRQGDATLYSSCSPHTVLPLTRGRRRALVVNVWARVQATAPQMRSLWWRRCVPLFEPLLARMAQARSPHQGSVHLQAGIFLMALEALERDGKGSRNREDVDALRARARKQLVAARELEPALHWAWHKEGVLLAGEGRLHEALDCFVTSTRLRPTEAENLYDLDLAYQQLGRYAEAVATCERALALVPNEPSAYRYLGKALDLDGKPRDAAAAYANSLRVRPAEGASPYIELARLKLDEAGADVKTSSQLSDKKKFEAYALYASAASLPSADAIHRFEAGHHLGYADRFEEAAHFMRAALRMQPELPQQPSSHPYVARVLRESYFHLGSALVQLGAPRVHEAREVLDTALSLAPNHFDARLQAGISAFVAGDHKAAVVHLRKARALLPNSAHLQGVIKQLMERGLPI